MSSFGRVHLWTETDQKLAAGLRVGRPDIFLFHRRVFLFQHGADCGILSSWLFPEIPSETSRRFMWPMRKLGHWSEYFVLAVLIMRALRNEAGKKWELRHATHSLIFVFLYAVSDELHQTFVPSRTRQLSAT